MLQLAHDSDDDEGLSEDRYLKTRYVPPSAEEALEKRKDSMFDGGEAPLWATTLTEMYSMGLGIGLYFNLVIYVSIVMACCALINIPSFVIFNGSENVPGEEVDFLALDRISLANFGIPEEEGDEGRGSNKTDTGSSTQQIDVFGGISSRTGIIIISWTTFTVAIFILGFTLTWKHHVKKATRMFDINNVTMSDYTIYATGFPENATVDEIHAHFDSLYNLWSDDWTSSGSATYCCLDRKVSKRQKFLDPEERKKVERRVRKLRKKGIMIPFPPDHSNISPVRDNSNTEDDRYLNSWIAEISMAHPNGTLIRRYQKLTNKLREIRSMRGLIKKYTQGLSMEADNEKRKKAVSRLQRLELQLKEIDIKFGELYSEKCVGAFVVFNNEESFRRCLFDYKSSNNPFTRVIQPMPLRFSRRQNGQTKTWKLNVDQAPEPEDVVWEHLEASQIERRFRQILVGLILIFLLCCSLGVLFLIESQNEVISRGIPEEEFCQNDLPAFSFGTRSFPEDAILVRNQTRADEACSPGENYFIWQSSIMKPQTNTTKDPCFSPCVDPDGSLECTDLDGNNFQHNMIGRCFCLEKLNRKIEQEGFFLGFVNISRSSDKLCRNLAALIILAEGMTLISAGAVVIINLMLKSIMRRVTKLERFDSLSQEKSAVAIKIFIAQFFNTGIAILLTNLRMPFGEAGIGSLRLLSGQFSSLSTDWHTTVGTSIMYTMLFNIFSPHLATASRALLSSWLRKCCRRRVVIQEEMDDLYRPEDFDIETRYPVLLNTFAVTMLYGSGMPILFVFAFASYVFSYWIDKWLLLRVYKRPAFIDESLARLATAMVPVTVLFYLVMGLYMFTDHERIPTIPLRFFGDDSGTKAYQSAVDAMDKYDVLGLAQRSLQEHTFSLFILAIVSTTTALNTLNLGLSFRLSILQICSSSSLGCLCTIPLENTFCSA